MSGMQEIREMNQKSKKGREDDIIVTPAPPTPTPTSEKKKKEKKKKKKKKKTMKKDKTNGKFKDKSKSKAKGKSKDKGKSKKKSSKSELSKSSSSNEEKEIKQPSQSKSSSGEYDSYESLDEDQIAIVKHFSDPKIFPQLSNTYNLLFNINNIKNEDELRRIIETHLRVFIKTESMELLLKKFGFVSKGIHKGKRVNFQEKETIDFVDRHIYLTLNGAFQQDPRYMSYEQYKKQMEDDGWNVVNHKKNHLKND